MDLAAAFTLTASLWLSLPRGDSVWDALETIVPFAFTDPMNTGGTMTGVPARAGRDAGSWTQTAYRIGLLDVTDLARGGEPLVYPAFSIAGEVRVHSAGAPVDASTPGLVLTLVPRSGADAWRGSASLTLAPFEASSSSRPPPVAALRSLWQADGTAGGPIAGGHGTLFADALVTRSTHVERREAYTLPGNVASFAAHATTGGSDARGELFGWAQQTETPFAGRARFASRDVTDRHRAFGVTGRWVIPSPTPLSVEGGIQHARSTPDASASAPNGTVERLIDGPVQDLAAESPGTRNRWSIAASVGPHLVHRHSLRAGGEWSRPAADVSPLGAGAIGERVDGIPARAWRYGVPADTHHHETVGALFVSDAIALGGAFTIEPGLRLEHMSASNGSASVGWTNVAPRLAARFTSGAWTAGAAARRYLAQVPLSVLDFGDPAGPQGQVFRWTDANGDGRVDPAELGPLIAVAGPGASASGVSSLDPAIRRPVTDELLAMAERRVGSNLTIALTGVTRREHDRFAAIDTGVPPSAYTVSTVFDPGLDLLGPEDDQLLPIYSRPPETFGRDRYLLTNAGGTTGTLDALDLRIATSGGQPLYVAVAGTAIRSRATAAYRGFHAAENDGVLPGDAFSDPNSRTNADGRPFTDRGYGLKLSTAYRAPRGVTLAAVARYADGQPFARLVLAPDLPQGPDVVRAYPNGRSRFTYTLTLDVRIEKRFAIGRGRLAAALEAFNALNTQHEVEEDTVTGPLYRTPTAVQPPRVIRFVVRAEF